MAHTERQQFMNVLNQSRDILITFRKEWSIDAVTSALALSRILEKKGKRAHIVCDNFEAPPSLHFLPDITNVKPRLEQVQKFVVSLNTTKAELGELSYEMKEGKLHIYLSPKNGTYAHHDIETSSSDSRYDLVITLDTPDYTSLAKPFHDHADFFYACPVVNIDHDPSNEQYGNMNIVDITATSTTEIIYRIFTEEKKHFLDNDVATCLYAGIVSKTKSFKTTNVTPKTLDVASDLLSAGARQEDVMRNLYRTRSLATLKLWGRALARLKFDPSTRMTWTLLVRQDFIHAGAGEHDLEGVIDELIANSPDAEIIGIIYEREDSENPGSSSGSCAMISSEAHGNALKLMASLRPEGHRNLARIHFPKTKLLEAEKATLHAIRTSLGRPGDMVNSNTFVDTPPSPIPFTNQ